MVKHTQKIRRLLTILCCERLKSSEILQPLTEQNLPTSLEQKYSYEDLQKFAVLGRVEMV